MMKSIALLWVGILLVAGCYQTKIKVDYILTDEQMAHLMLDLQLSEVALTELTGVKQDSLRDVFWLRYSEVYKHPKADLEAEIRKLETDPEKLKTVMERVQVLSDSLR